MEFFMSILMGFIWAAFVVVVSLQESHVLRSSDQDVAHDLLVQFCFLLVVKLLIEMQQQLAFRKILVFVNPSCLEWVTFEEVDQLALLRRHHVVDQKPGLAQGLDYLDQVDLLIELELGVLLALVFARGHAAVFGDFEAFAAAANEVVDEFHCSEGVHFAPQVEETDVAKRKACFRLHDAHKVIDCLNFLR